jgi:hypothetical protein
VVLIGVGVCGLGAVLTCLMAVDRSWFEPVVRVVAQVAFDRHGSHYVYEPGHYPLFVWGIAALTATMAGCCVYTLVTKSATDRKIDRYLRRGLSENSSRNTRSMGR